MDEYPRTSRSHRHSRRHSSHRSRSYSPRESTTTTENNHKQTQFVPISVPYYQPQTQPSQSAPIISTNKSQPISYIIPHVKQQFIEENNHQPSVRIFFSIKKKIFFLI
jgi:hypothetical protein